jgi:NIPSNAP protein
MAKLKKGHSWAFVVVGLLLGAGFAQLRAAQPPPARVFEIRTYHCFPGRLDALHKRFREHTMKMFEKHGMTNVAYWTFQDSPAKEDTLIYVISHASREQARANWAAFSADPEWQKIAADSQVDGKIVEKVESVFVDATDYSPLK